MFFGTAGGVRSGRYGNLGYGKAGKVGSVLLWYVCMSSGKASPGKAGMVR